MNRTHFVVACIFMVLGVFGCGRTSKEASPTPELDDYSRMQGKWRFRDVKEFGPRSNDDVIKSGRMTINGRWIVMDMDPPHPGFPKREFTFEVFPDRPIKAIDLTLPGKDPPVRAQGIYKWDGDTLMLFLNAVGGGRPTEITDPPDASQALYVLERPKR